MDGRVDLARDLRLVLDAIEAGAINREQLVSALRAWARSADRTLPEVLARRGLLDPAALNRLLHEDAMASGPPNGGPMPGREADEHPSQQPGRPGSHEPTVTVHPAGRPPGDMDGEIDRAATTVPDAGVVGQRFRVLRPLARGGLGEVHLALDGELDRHVALKELQPRRARDPDAQARFLVEARITGRLEHPGIIPVYSLGRHADGRPYYAMRLIEGDTLRDAIERYHRTRPATRGEDDRTLAFRRLLRAVIDACNAVAYAHSRGVVHRDLKPENIMLGPFGETLVVDWGVAKALHDAGAERTEPQAGASPPADASMTQPGTLIGTPRYMSPEQAAGDVDRIGPASDIYSLGAILYCLLVGHAPFPDGDLPSVLERVRRGIFPAPRRLRRSIHPTLEAICLRAMALDPAARHTSALELAADLEAWQADVRYRGEQEQALGEMRAALTRLRLERAHACFGRAAHAEGMLWLARALEDTPSEPPELQRVIRTSLGAWYAGVKLLERSIRHGGEVHALAFCAEGRRLATAGGDHAARVWDIATGSRLLPPLRHAGPVRAVVFRADGGAVVTAGDDGVIRTWDALTGELIGDPIRVGGPVAALAFSPDGSRVAAAGGRGGAFLWEAVTGRPAHEPPSPDATALAVAFSPDGATLAVACDDGAVYLLEAASGLPLGAPLAHGSAVQALAFDLGGERLLAGCRDGQARLWDIAGGMAILTLAHPGAVRCLGFRPGGGAVATACTGGPARLWHTATGLPIGEPLAHESGVACLAFRPDGTMVATGGADGAVRLWCAGTGLPIGPPLARGRPVQMLAFSPDGRRLAACGPGATAHCWCAPEAVEGDAVRIGCWVGVMTGLEFDAGDAIRPMAGPTRWDLQRRLTDLGGPPVREADHHRTARLDA